MMDPNPDRRLTGPAIALVLGLTVFAVGCGKKEDVAAPSPAAAAPTETTPAAVEPTAMQQPAQQSWTPEALEELLAPIALYPDPVLSQVLIASTNPQEVLDAGNWLLQNQSLQGKELDDAATKIGFTPPIRSLIQFPETVDMMCMELDWTTELGQAFIADQAGVLDAVQRLRKQAMDVGNLKSSDMLKVDTEVQDGKEVVVVSPPKPEVIYVPQYDPQAVYAPPPATVPAATTTTTEKTGHSTGSLITTGLLAFGAGMLVNEIFDDDDDYHNHHNDYYYPNYGHGGMPYYPPYAYRPAYGGGYYPSNGYNRPPNYQHGFNNNNVVVINNGNDNYWNDRKARSTGYQKAGANQARSPITKNNPRRTDLQELNKRQPKPMPQDARRPSPTATKDNWKSQGTYAGNKAGKDKGYAGKAGAGVSASNRVPGSAPKVQGSYGGASPDRAKPATRDTQRPQPGAQPGAYGKDKAGNRPQGDRGYAGQGQGQRPQQVDRDTQKDRPQQQNRPTPQQKDRSPSQGQPVNRPSPSTGGGGDRSSAVSGANRSGNADRQASQRGKQSMPQGARSKGGGGKKKQGR
ncbi:MAG TPA: DUF3300 domain-containing protein [Steroidobacteraceae bacterium]